jgi:hypothetical protein
MRRTLLGLVVILALASSACSGGSRDEAGATARVTAGTAETAPAGASTFSAMPASGPAAVGTTIRTASDGRVTITFSDGSIAYLGTGATLALTAASRSQAGGLQVRLRLDAGTAWVILEGESIEITTPAGVATVSGSMMGVAVGGGTTKVQCAEGHCGLSNAAGQLSLTAGQGGVIGSIGRHPELDAYTEIEPCDMTSPDCTPRNPLPSAQPTATPAASRATTKPTALPALPTPFAVATSSAGRSGDPIPTPFALRTPNPNGTTGPDGLTPEERANAGSHAYDFGCGATNGCECNREAAGATFTIAFTRDTVTLTVGTDSITYQRTGPNTYEWKQGTTVAIITFSLDGWTFDTRKGGAACVIQTFRLLPNS